MEKKHLNNKVHQFVLQHRLRMKIGDQKRNIIPLTHVNPQNPRQGAYRNRFPSQDDKTLCPSSEESSQFMSEDTFNFIRLFDFDANADRVDGRLDKHLFVLIAGYMQWIQDNFRRCPEVNMIWRGWKVLCFNFGDVVSFDDLA